MGCGCDDKLNKGDSTLDDTSAADLQDGDVSKSTDTSQVKILHKARGGFRSYRTLTQLDSICRSCSDFDTETSGCGKDKVCDRAELYPLRLQQGYCYKWRREDARKIILQTFLSPGDILTLTAAVESLHVTFPGEFITGVKTTIPAIWENNPHITNLDENEPGTQTLSMNYPSISVSGQTSVCFLEAYTADLSVKVKRNIRIVTNHPVLYLSDDEKKWANQVLTTWESSYKTRTVPFWLVSAGVKSDFTTKQWPIEHYQEVINRTKGYIQWVQVGSLDHDHPQLSGVLDLRGRTDTRQLIRLCYHAQGGLGPVTFLQHLMAAFEKPYMCILGGREPVIWTQYAMQQTFHTLGVLPCCKKVACWRSRVIPLGDGSERDRSLCAYPMLGSARPYPRCMGMITPDRVVDVLKMYASHLV